MIVQFRNEKVSNHGSIPITIDCNVVAVIVFEEGFHQPIKRTKQYGSKVMTAYTRRSKTSFSTRNSGRKKLSERDRRVLKSIVTSKKRTAASDRRALSTSRFSSFNNYSGCTFGGHPVQGVANVVPAPVDDVGDQKRMVLLPEEVGEEGFIESSPPTFRDGLVYKKACGRTVVRVPAGSRNMLCMYSVRARSLQRRMLRVQLEENESDYGEYLYNADVRCG
ncbi:hypothetical protein TNCV_1777341 [Trichonephila clavipes]|nr:hypothetical protein TNCV_1777341 [Trichonephila clavipes]